VIFALIIMALTLAGGMIIVAYTYKLQKGTSRIMETNVRSMKAAHELEIALFDMRGLIFNYIIDKSPKWIDSLNKVEIEFIISLNRASETSNTPEESNLIQQISALFFNFEQDFKKAVVDYKRGYITQANSLLLHVNQNLFQTIYDKCKLFIQLNELDQTFYQENLQRINDSIRTAMYGLGFAGIVMGLILGWVISRIILNPIYELILKVRGAADGELVESLRMSPGRELKKVDEHIKGLVVRINKAHEDLEKNRQLLERSNRLATLGKMASGIAHEIRNPLTAIKMLIFSIKQNKESSQEMHADLEIIIKEIDRMDNIIQSVLKFAKPNVPSFTPTDVQVVLRETLYLLGPRIRQNRIDVSESYYPKAGTIQADPDQLKQVFMNIILNAMDAMHDGGVLGISTLVVEEDIKSVKQKALKISISDTGQGISGEIKDTLFDPFVKSKDYGVGLGLSITQQIIELHQGKIIASNNPDKGATFTIYLPFVV
jgi:signal transduction histidine kinase